MAWWNLCETVASRCMPCWSSMPNSFKHRSPCEAHECHRRRSLVCRRPMRRLERQRDLYAAGGVSAQAALNAFTERFELLRQAQAWAATMTESDVDARKPLQRLSNRRRGPAHLAPASF